MDGFTGFKTATTEELPDAVAVMDPFHVVRLAGDALDRCRRRIQQIIHGHRGRADDPLYRARRTLHTGVDLLTDKQQQRLQTLFADDNHVQVAHASTRPASRSCTRSSRRLHRRVSRGTSGPCWMAGFTRARVMELGSRGGCDGAG